MNVLCTSVQVHMCTRAYVELVKPTVHCINNEVNVKIQEAKVDSSKRGRRDR